jgi:hypothetical protein
MSRKGWKTAEGLMAELNADPNYRRRRAEKDRRLQERLERYAAAERPVLEKLKALGVEANSVEEVTTKYCPLPEPVVDVLLGELAGIAENVILEMMIRAIGAAAQPFDGRPLVACYEAKNDPTLRWVILNTVAIAKPHSIDEWIDKAFQDPWMGKTLRQLGYRKKRPRSGPAAPPS